VWGRAYDIAIIGGGITGCGVARDAAGRGFSVLLCDEGDLGGGSTSASPKLLHGGPGGLSRLLGGEERAALEERDLLVAAAPHIVRPVRLVVPDRGRRIPRILSRARFAVHDRLARGSALGATLPVTLGADRLGKTLRPEFVSGFEYSDAKVDDSRLVVLTASDARMRGAQIRPRTRCVVAEREGTLWRLALESETGERMAITARALVNAAGPWSPAVVDHVIHARARPAVRLVKGTTLVIPRLYDHDRGYVLRNTDGRTLFVVPYQRDLTLIGTAEEDYDGDPAEAVADSAEIAYLIAAVGEYFRRPLFEDDVVWAWAGVRAVPDPIERRFFFDRSGGRTVHLEATGREPPLVNVIGGSIAMHRRLAESVLDRLAPFIGARPAWTAGSGLPGGLFPIDGIGELARGLRSLYPFLTARHAARLVAQYGTRAHTIVSGARSMADLGTCFGSDLTEAEVGYLIDEEWATTAEDILWRRTKLGLRFRAEQVAALEAWLGRAVAGAPGMPHVGAA
jgi:glycerol-3-phosphate dehydrogenase